METQDLVKVVEDYCKTASPSYAIMIGGPWGCGKTTFIKNFFADPEKKMVYVSLYGVSTLDQIKDKILTSLTSIDGASDEEIKKTGKFIGSVLKAFTETGNNSAVGTIVSTIGSTIKSRILRSLDKDIILIFDDLERTELAVHVALSCINEFVEHQGLKAIIVGDETKISEDKYRPYKEKLILYTYQVDQSVDEKVAIAFKGKPEIPNESLDLYKKELLGLLQNLDCNNLRTIKLAVSSFLKLISALDKGQHPKKSDPRLVELLFPCLAYAIGYRDMQLTSAQLLSFSGSKLKTVLQAKTTISPDDPEPSWRKTFDETVVGKSNRSVQVKSAYKIVCLGHLDYSSLLEDIEKWEPILDNSKMNLINYNYNFTNEEFNKMVRSVISDIGLRKLEFCSAHEMLVLINHLHYLVESGAVDYRIEDLEAEITTFVDDAIDNGKYGNPQILHKANTTVESYLEEITSHVVDRVNQQVRSNELSILRCDLITTIASNNEEEISTAYRALYHNSTKPFILDDFVDTMMAELENTSAKNLQDFCQFLKRRYDTTNIFEYLGDEIPALKNFRVKLKEYIAGQDASLTKFHIRKLVTMIDTVIKSGQQDEQ